MRNLIAFFLAFVLAVVATVCDAQPAYDPVTSDPPSTDAQFPPTLTAFSIQSGGVAINARGLLAQGKGPHPTVLLMHGFPGNELNMDLAQAMRRAGWNVFMFHYRGNWGSGGNYEFRNVLEDTTAMVAHLRAKGADPAYRVDAGHIVLVGHSVGGFAALNTAAADAQIKSVASISGFDVARAGEAFAADEKMRGGIKAFVGSLRSIAAPDPEMFVAHWTTAPAEWKFTGLAPRLATKNVLLVAGTKDTLAVMARHHTPLADALKAVPDAKLTTVVIDTDHSYSDKRIALMRAVVDWLQKQ